MSTKSRAKAASGAALHPEPKPVLIGWGTLVAGGIIVASALAAYHNSFSGPFILDDQSAIVDNASITHLATAGSPPVEATTGGRPLLNLTFALNYAMGGMQVGGYHAFNLLIHVLAGLTLFGIFRRTLPRPALGGRFAAGAWPLALAVAVIWVVHPLQTEAVTYVSQRAESLMALFYLLTLYFFIRSVDSGVPARWQVLSVTACLLGVMIKEVIVTAPVIILLYDRTFAAGSYQQAWRRRWRYYLGLAGTWLLLACSIAGLHKRGVGFEQGVTAWSYALTSCRSVVLYLKLAVWPHPLVFDYGYHIFRHASEVAPYALILAAWVVSTAVALRRWPAIGFAGAWLFVILGPTSSVVPIAYQPMAEHRMYLPLAAVIGVFVLGVYAWIGRRSLWVFAAAAVGLGWMTVQRNEVYGTKLAIWSDTAAKSPDNARALCSLGNALKDLGRSKEAITEYQSALRIEPNYTEAHNKLGRVLSSIPGRLPEAISHYEAALLLNPKYAEAHNNLGMALAGISGRLPEAVSHYEAALQIKPDYAEAHTNLGVALANIPGRLPEAIAQVQEALRINPDYAEAHNNLANILVRVPGRLPEAIHEYEAALRIKPDLEESHINLAMALWQTPGRYPEAVAHLEAALRINPDDAEAHFNLARLLMGSPGRLPDAIAHLEAALRIKPDSAETHNSLGIAFAHAPGHATEAIGQFEEALRINPGFVEAHDNLGITLVNLGRLNEAVAQFEAALRIKPDDPSAHRFLELSQRMLQKNAGRRLDE